MPLVKDINITVRNETSAVATFTQLFEGYWEVAEIEFVRVAGTVTWKPIIPRGMDVLHEAKTAVTRLMNERHGSTGLPPALRRDFKAPTHTRNLPRINAPAGVVVRDADAPPVTPVKPRMTPVTPTPLAELPESCDCKTHTNTYARGSAKWHSHALSFRCVGAAPQKAEPVADGRHTQRARDAARVVEAAERAESSGVSPNRVFKIEREFWKDRMSADECVSQLLALIRH